MDTHNTLNYIMVSKDPRCPYCGKPVIGQAVTGIEGSYHPECTRPPVSSFIPGPVQPYVPHEPLHPWPGPWTNLTPSLPPVPNVTTWSHGSCGACLPSP